MKTTVRVTPDNQLPLPPQVRESLHPGDEYSVSVTEETIVFTKVSPPANLDEFFQDLRSLEPDPSQPSLQEIADLVREARQERRLQEQQHQG